MDEQQQQLVTPASGGGNPPNLATNTQPPSKRGSVSGGGGGGGGGRGGQNQQPQQHPPQMLKDIVAPHQHDVLCGRGGGTNNHVGNELFRTLVNNKKRAYLNSCKRDKPSVSRGIVASIRGLDPPGRFLSRDEHTGLWFDIGDQKAREKTSQALREGAPEIRKEMGFREWPDGAAGKPPGGPGPGGYNRSASAPAHVLSSMMQMQHHRHRQHQQQPPQPSQQPPPQPPQPPQPQQRPQPRPSQGGGVNPPPSMASAGLPPPQTSFQSDAAAASQELRGLPRRPSEPAASGTGGEAGQQAAGAPPPASTSHAFPSHITPDAAKVLIQFLQTQQAKDTPGGMVSSALSPSQQQAVAAGGVEDLASASAQTALLKAAYQQQQLELQSQSERLQQLTQRLQLQQQQQQAGGGGEQQPPQTPPTSHHMSPSLVQQHQYDGGHRRPSTLVEQLVTGSPAAGGSSELIPPTTTMSRGPSGGDPTGLAMERMRRASLAEQQHLHQRMDVPVARSASHSFADADGDAAGTEMSVPASPGKNGQGRPSSMVDDSKEREEDDMDYLKDLPPDVRNRLEVVEYLAECHRSGRGAREDEEGAIGEVRRNAELFQTLGLLGVDAAVIGKAMREGRPLKSLVEEVVAGENGAAAAPVAASSSSTAAGVAVKMEGVDDTAVTRQVTDDDMVVPGSKGADEDATKRVDPALEGGTKDGTATTGSVAKGLVGEQDMNVDKDSTTTRKKGDAPVKKRKLVEADGGEDSRQPFFPRNRIHDALSRMGVVASE